MTVTELRKSVSTIRAYARVSVFHEASQQIEQARHLIGKWAAFKYPDAEVVFYVDEAVSGAKPMAKRPRGGKLLRELQRGDVLAVTKLDRLARNLDDLLGILRQVEDTGASFVATEQEISTEGPYGRFTLVLLGAVAELERAIMGERQQAAREQLRRDRRHVGRVHYGFTTVPHPDGKGLAVRPHPVEGPKLRAAVEAVLAGASIASQARVLGVLPTNLRMLLRSPRLIGRVPVAVTVTEMGEDGKEREKVVGWEADSEIPADPKAALIPVSMWSQLRAKFERDDPRSWTLTDGYGVALACHQCKGRMYLDVNSGAAGGYRCHGHKGAPTVSRRMVDEFVNDWFLSRHGSRQVMEAVRDNDMDRRERLAVVSLALREATEAMLRPGADVPALAQRVTELHAERAAIETEPGRRKDRLVPTDRTVADVWAESTDADRVTMLRTRVVFVIHPRGRANGRIEPVTVEEEPERWEELTRSLPDPLSSAAARQGGSVVLTMPLTRELHEQVRS